MEIVEHIKRTPWVGGCVGSPFQEGLSEGLSMQVTWKLRYKWVEGGSSENLEEECSKYLCSQRIG